MEHKQQIKDPNTYDLNCTGETERDNLIIKCLTVL